LIDGPEDLIADPTKRHKPRHTGGRRRFETVVGFESGPGRLMSEHLAGLNWNPDAPE